MTENILTKKYWIVHHRDGRPREIYDNVDDAWAVSISETEAGRPQPYIQTYSPEGKTST